VVVPVLLAAGFIVGLALGRWSALIGAVVVGIAVGVTSEVEVSPIVLGVGYGLVSAFAIAMGVALRRTVGRRAA
jgi:drug/metabolite transporter (DMT)-like permease